MWRNRLIKISTLVREEPEKEKKPLKLNSPAGQKKKFKSRDLKFLTEPQSFEIFLNVRRKTKILTEFLFSFQELFAISCFSISMSSTLIMTKVIENFCSGSTDKIETSGVLKPRQLWGVALSLDQVSGVNLLHLNTCLQ